MWGISELSYFALRYNSFKLSLLKLFSNTDMIEINRQLLAFESLCILGNNYAIAMKYLLIGRIVVNVHDM